MVAVTSSTTAITMVSLSSHQPGEYRRAEKDQDQDAPELVQEPQHCGSAGLLDQ